MSGEEMADLLFLISNISLILAAVCAVPAAVIFVRLRIPSVINDLSGKTARRSIEKMRSQSAPAEKREDADGTAPLQNRRKVTEETAPLKMSPGVAEETAPLKMFTGVAEETAPLYRKPAEKVNGIRSAGNVLQDIETVLIVHTDEEIP